MPPLHTCRTSRGVGDLHARLQFRCRPQRPLHRQLPDPPLRHQRQPRRDAPLRRRRRRRRAREGVAARRRPDRRRAEAEEERASRCGRGERSVAVACSVRGASSSVVSGEVVRRHATDRVCECLGVAARLSAWSAWYVTLCLYYCCIITTLEASTSPDPRRAERGCSGTVTSHLHARRGRGSHPLDRVWCARASRTCPWM